MRASISRGAITTSASSVAASGVRAGWSRRSTTSRFAPRRPQRGSGAGRLLGGGLDRGTSALSSARGRESRCWPRSIASAAARRGEAASIYAFDESIQHPHGASGSAGDAGNGADRVRRLRVRQTIRPRCLRERWWIRSARVEARATRVLVIDSLNGFLARCRGTVPDVQLHELPRTAQRGVLTILTLAQAGMIGQMTSPVDVSFLADTVVLLRFFERRAKCARPSPCSAAAGQARHGHPRARAWTRAACAWERASPTCRAVLTGSRASSGGE